MADDKYTDSDLSQVSRDLSALQDADVDTSDAGRANKSFDASEVANLTGTSSSKAAEAGHVARDDMAEAGDMGIPADRHG